MVVPSVGRGITPVVSGVTPVEGFVLGMVLGVVALVVVCVLPVVPVVLVVSGMRLRQPLNIATTNNSVKIKIPALLMESPPVLLGFVAIISHNTGFTLAICAIWIENEDKGKSLVFVVFSVAFFRPSMYNIFVNI